MSKDKAVKTAFYNPRRRRVTVPIAVDAEGKPAAGRVKQEFKREVDINYIRDRMKHGVQPPSWMTSKTPRFGDFTQGPQNFMEAFDTVARAQEAFLALPVEFRRELDHDPRNLANAPRELYERFGLLKKPEAPGSGSAAPGAPASRGVGGEKDLPATAPSGANKGASSKAPSESSEK